MEHKRKSVRPGGAIPPSVKWIEYTRRLRHCKSTERSERTCSLLFRGTDHILFCWFRTHEKIVNDSSGSRGMPEDHVPKRYDFHLGEI